MEVLVSPYADALFIGILMDAARALLGVIASFVREEIVVNFPPVETIPIPIPGLKKPTRKALAIDRVRYVGDPVAVVLAENFYTALDARDLVEVDYEPLLAVTDAEDALAPDAPLLYDEFGTNVA